MLTSYDRIQAFDTWSRLPTKVLFLLDFAHFLSTVLGAVFSILWPQADLKDHQFNRPII